MDAKNTEETPVAKLALDTRAHGPYFCAECSAENEDALLMSDASVACPECWVPMPEFQLFSDAITSASPIRKSEKFAVPGAEKWIVEWKGPDTSREMTTAYDTREEALEIAADWAANQAKEYIDETIGMETEFETELSMLKEVIDSNEKKNHIGVVKAWLDFQSETDPSEKMSIGPSSYVTDRSSELS